jgi:hypothetical protein
MIHEKKMSTEVAKKVKKTKVKTKTAKKVKEEPVVVKSLPSGDVINHANDVETSSEEKKSFSKTTTTNIDNIIRLMIDEFKLEEKEVRKTLKELLPSTSEFKKKKKRDPTKPKKNNSSYMFFTQDQRSVVQKEKPDMKITEVTSELGRRWHTLSDSDKKPYQKKADVDKVRYQTELSAWKKENGIEDKPKNDKANDSNFIQNPKSGKWVKKDGPTGKKLVASVSA